MFCRVILNFVVEPTSMVSLCPFSSKFFLRCFVPESWDGSSIDVSKVNNWCFNKCFTLEAMEARKGDLFLHFLSKLQCFLLGQDSSHWGVRANEGSSWILLQAGTVVSTSRIFGTLKILATPLHIEVVYLLALGCQQQY